MHTNRAGEKKVNRPLTRVYIMYVSLIEEAIQFPDSLSTYAQM